MALPARKAIKSKARLKTKPARGRAKELVVKAAISRSLLRPDEIQRMKRTLGFATETIIGTFELGAWRSGSYRNTFAIPTQGTIDLARTSIVVGVGDFSNSDYAVGMQYTFRVNQLTASGAQYNSLMVDMSVFIGDTDGYLHSINFVAIVFYR